MLYIVKTKILEAKDSVNRRNLHHFNDGAMKKQSFN